MEKLSLDKLKELGSFSGAPVEKEVTWKQGDQEHTFTVFVRRLSYQEGKLEAEHYRKNKSDLMASRIASSILDEDGKPIFDIGDITGENDPERGPLNFSLTAALMNVINEVNNLGKNTSSPAKKNSGTN